MVYNIKRFLESFFALSRYNAVFGKRLIFINIALFGFLLFCLSFVLFLCAGGYPLFPAEGDNLTLTIFPAFLLPALPVAWLFMHRKGTAYGGTALLLFLFIYYSFQQHLVIDSGAIFANNFVGLLPDVALTYLSTHGNFILAALIAFLFYQMLPSHFIPVMPIANVMVAGILCWASVQNMQATADQPQAEPQKNEAAGPLFLHLVLADHISPLYLNNIKEQKLPAPTNETRPSYYLFDKVVGDTDFIGKFYKKYAFSYYPKAYSVTESSILSLAKTLNFDQKDKNEELVSHHASLVRPLQPPAYTLNRNEYFKRLKDNGFKISAYPSDYINFCGGAGGAQVDTCHPDEKTLPPLYKESSNTLTGRSGLLFAHYLASFPSFEQKIASLQEACPSYFSPSTCASMPLVGYRGYQIRSFGEPEKFDRILSDMKASPGQEAFIAHLMLPHHPYIYDRQCRLIPTDKWVENTRFRKKGGSFSRAERLKFYTDQLACLYKKMDGFFTDMKKDGLLDRTIVLIHGDRGSNILLGDATTKTENIRHKVIRRFKDRYATLFALHLSNQKDFRLFTDGCDTATLLGRALFGDRQSTCAPITLHEADHLQDDDMMKDSINNWFLAEDNSYRIPALSEADKTLSLVPPPAFETVTVPKIEKETYETSTSPEEQRRREEIEKQLMTLPTNLDELKELDIMQEPIVTLPEKTPEELAAEEKARNVERLLNKYKAKEDHFDTLIQDQDTESRNPSTLVPQYNRSNQKLFKPTYQ